MTTATQETAAVLLPIDQVVEQAVAAARADGEQRERHAVEAQLNAERETVARFHRLLRDQFHIEASDGEEIAFEVGGRTFGLTLGTYSYIHVTEACPACPDGAVATARVTKPLELGQFIVDRLATRELCEDCEMAARPPAPARAARAPTLAERLEAIVREIALDAAMEAREL